MSFGKRWLHFKSRKSGLLYDTDELPESAASSQFRSSASMLSFSFFFGVPRPLELNFSAQVFGISQTKSPRPLSNFPNPAGNEGNAEGFA